MWSSTFSKVGSLPPKFNICRWKQQFPAFFLPPGFFILILINLFGSFCCRLFNSLFLVCCLLSKITRLLEHQKFCQNFVVEVLPMRTFMKTVLHRELVGPGLTLLPVRHAFRNSALGSKPKNSCEAHKRTYHSKIRSSPDTCIIWSWFVP